MIWSVGSVEVGATLNTAIQRGCVHHLIAIHPEDIRPVLIVDQQEYVWLVRERATAWAIMEFSRATVNRPPIVCSRLPPALV